MFELDFNIVESKKDSFRIILLTHLLFLFTELSFKRIQYFKRKNIFNHML